MGPKVIRFVIVLITCLKLSETLEVVNKHQNIVINNDSEESKSNRGLAYNRPNRASEYGIATLQSVDNIGLSPSYNFSKAVKELSTSNSYVIGVNGKHEIRVPTQTEHVENQHKLLSSYGTNLLKFEKPTQMLSFVNHKEEKDVRNATQIHENHIPVLSYSRLPHNEFTLQIQRFNSSVPVKANIIKQKSRIINAAVPFKFGSLQTYDLPRIRYNAFGRPFVYNPRLYGGYFVTRNYMPKVLETLGMPSSQYNQLDSSNKTPILSYGTLLKNNLTNSYKNAYSNKQIRLANVSFNEMNSSNIPRVFANKGHAPESPRSVHKRIKIVQSDFKSPHAILWNQNEQFTIKNDLGKEMNSPIAENDFISNQGLFQYPTESQTVQYEQPSQQDTIYKTNILPKLPLEYQSKQASDTITLSKFISKLNTLPITQHVLSEHIKSSGVPGEDTVTKIEKTDASHDFSNIQGKVKSFFANLSKIQTKLDFEKNKLPCGRNKTTNISTKLKQNKLHEIPTENNNGSREVIHSIKTYKNVYGTEDDDEFDYQEVECMIGSKWLSNCHLCICSETGVAECEHLPNCVLRPHGEPMPCKPYSQYDLDECNKCECNGDGVPMCTLIDCKNIYAYEIDQVLRTFENDCPCKSKLAKCAPKTTWQSSGYSCTCEENGQRYCVKAETSKTLPYGQPGRCQPNTSFKTECRQCTCDDEGQSMCIKTC